MRVTVTAAGETPFSPKLLSFRGLNDPWVILATSESTGVTLIQGASQYPVGERITMTRADHWEPFDGAVTLQN